LRKPWLKNWPDYVPRTIKYPRAPLHWLLTNAAERFKEDIALLYEDRAFTFAELASKAASFAGWLANIGVSKGLRVALYMANSPFFVIGYYGSLMAGATVVALNPLLKEREAIYQLEDAEVEVIVADEVGYATLKRIEQAVKVSKLVLTGTSSSEAPSLEGIAALGLKRPEVKVKPEEDVAVIQYTAGTTAEPKGVMLTHYNLLSNAIAIANVTLLRRHEVQLGALPLYHSYGMTNVMNASLYVGASVALMKRFDVEAALRIIEKHRVNVWFGVPTMFIAALHHLKTCPHDLSSLRFCNSGGGPIASEVVEEFEKLTGVLLMQGYGLSEASPVTHSNIPVKGLVKNNSVGMPLPDTEAKIVDLDLGFKELPPGEVGELVVRGPQVMKGYWKKPIETAEALRNGWLYTGDIAWMDEEGYFYVVDRKKDVIKYKGYSISPRELEDVLYAHPAVKECAVVGKPDPIAGEVPKAIIVLREGFQTTPEEIMKFVEERVAPYKKIREVEFREELPKSAIGKILRRLLRS